MSKKADFKMLEGYIRDLKIQKYSPEQICEEVCKEYNIELLTKRDKKKLKRYVNNV